MGIIIHNKLVRNKIPDIIKADGQVATIRTLSEDEYKKALLEKLVEEAREVLESDGSIEELADVMQVLADIQQEFTIAGADIESARVSKEAKRGGFDQRIFLEQVETRD